MLNQPFFPKASIARFSALLAVLFLLAGLVAFTAGCGDDGEVVTADTVPGTDTQEGYDERLDPYDTGGQTPEGVLEQYLTAVQEGDWERAYELQAEEGRPALEEYVAERGSTGEELVEFSINDRRMLNTAEAQVAVSTAVRSGGNASVVETENWWNMVKEHGYWVVPAEPVQ